MVCYVRLHEWDAVDRVIKQAARFRATDPTVRGELLTTQAEAAWIRGMHDSAQRLIKRAKHYLGDTQTLSWFRSRLLELQLTPVPEQDFMRRVAELDRQRSALWDSNRATSIDIAITRVAFECGHMEVVRQRLTRLESSMRG